jgi:hypothetical protein
MCKPPWSTWSHSSFVPVTRSLQVLLPASESAAEVEPCGEPAISLHSHHVSLVQWTTGLLPIIKDPGSNPQGGTYVKRDSPVSIVLLQCYVYVIHMHMNINRNMLMNMNYWTRTDMNMDMMLKTWMLECQRRSKFSSSIATFTVGPTR